MWIEKKPEFSNQIRVNRGLYYHHGIYLSDECVIHFAAVGDDSILDPSKARIIETSLTDFLRGGQLEVRDYSIDEKSKLRKPNEIANYALSCLGNGGYDIIRNNCEHFSNECAFGQKESNQIHDVISALFGFFNRN